jgi:hypothetical protein
MGRWVGKGAETLFCGWQGRYSRLLLLTLWAGLSLSGWLPALWAQGIEPSNRVGITLLGHHLWVHWRACGTIREAGPPAGTDGQVLSGPNLCDRTAWWQVAWSNGQQGWCAERRMSRRQLLPLPGEGVYPNISAAGAYPVQVAPDDESLSAPLSLIIPPSVYHYSRLMTQWLQQVQHALSDGAEVDEDVTHRCACTGPRESVHSRFVPYTRVKQPLIALVFGGGRW